MKETLLSRAKVTGAPSAKGRATLLLLLLIQPLLQHERVNLSYHHRVSQFGTVADGHEG